jgi:hypothetical protein
MGATDLGPTEDAAEVQSFETTVSIPSPNDTLDTRYDRNDSLLRENLLRRFGVFSASLFSAAFVQGMMTPSASAGGSDGCCDLIFPSMSCSGSGPNFSCPSGYHPEAWSCCVGDQAWGCGECIQNGENMDTCFAVLPPPACSEGPWVIPGVGCP